MKDHLLQLVQATNPVQGRNIVREYLQARILGALQRAGAMVPLAFQGGTSLRFLFALPRYSEDLDFTLEGDPAHYDFRAYLETIRAELSLEGYEVGLKVKDQRTVHSALVRFRGILYDLGLSPHQNEVLAVKIDVDTNPPDGAELETSLVRRHVLLRLQHHDRASLLAGKLHAILQRPYTKGRDLYDLIWYLSEREWPMPNLTLLNAALEQSHWSGEVLTEQTWRGVVSSRLQALDWERAAADVRPFLEREEDVEWLAIENAMQLLAG